MKSSINSMTFMKKIYTKLNTFIILISCIFYYTQLLFLKIDINYFHCLIISSKFVFAFENFVNQIKKSKMSIFLQNLKNLRNFLAV